LGTPGRLFKSQCFSDFPEVTSSPRPQIHAKNTSGVANLLISRKQEFSRPLSAFFLGDISSSDHGYSTWFVPSYTFPISESYPSQPSSELELLALLLHRVAGLSTGNRLGPPLFILKDGIQAGIRQIAPSYGSHTSMPSQNSGQFSQPPLPHILTSS
jgi:hypothetical protein